MLKHADVESIKALWRHIVKMMGNLFGTCEL